MMQDYLALQGVYRSKPTVRSYMAELGLKSSLFQVKSNQVPGEKHHVFPDLVQRQFSVSGPNQVWVTDFTYLKLEDGSKRYNCTIIDLYRRRVVATLNSSNIDAQLAIDTLEIALKRYKPPKGLILHSDQGTQFTSTAFNKLCKRRHVQQSMGRVGCPGDNAVIERFFNTFKNEHYKHYSFDSIEKLDKSTYDFMLIKYNHLRPHSFNNGKPPAWRLKAS